MARRLTSWALLGALAFLPTGCVVLDATTVGFAMVSGHRLITVSGEAKWAQPKQSVTAVNLVTGAVLARAALDDSKRFSVRVSLPVNEDLAIALHAPGSAGLLLAPRGEKRQEERALDLTRGSTTIAWALGSALGGIPQPGNAVWSAKTDQWKALGERLPVSYGVALHAGASTLDTLGVGSPAAAASELSAALKSALETVRGAAGGHPRDLVLWPPILLGWSNALGALPPSTGDEMAPQAAASLDIQTALEQIWAQHPYGAEQGGIELRVPLRETATSRLPEALPAVIHGLRYQVRASMLQAPREATIGRSGIRFQSGAVVLGIPDMPEGFASLDVELLGANATSLGKVNAQGLVNRAMIRALESTPIEVSLEGTPTTRPGIR